VPGANVTFGAPDAARSTFSPAGGDELALGDPDAPKVTKSPPTPAGGGAEVDNVTLNHPAASSVTFALRENVNLTAEWSAASSVMLSGSALGPATARAARSRATPGPLRVARPDPLPGRSPRSTAGPLDTILCGPLASLPCGPLASLPCAPLASFPCAPLASFPCAPLAAFPARRSPGSSARPLAPIPKP
jgi:hypothetical protein